MIDAIIEEIEIEASPETVFEAWTDPQQLLAWWRQDELKKQQVGKLICAQAANGMLRVLNHQANNFQ